MHLEGLPRRLTDGFREDESPHARRSELNSSESDIDEEEEVEDAYSKALKAKKARSAAKSKDMKRYIKLRDCTISLEFRLTYLHTWNH